MGRLDGDGDGWAFRSNLVREVAYGRLTKHDRAHRHAGIASWIETMIGETSAGRIATCVLGMDL